MYYLLTNGAPQIMDSAQREPDGLLRIFEIVENFYSTSIDDHLLVFALLCLIIFDIVLGVARAWAQHNFSSSKLRKGVVSHVSVFLAVFFTYPFALHAGAVVYINGFILSMVASYGASILKNLSVLGVKFPALDAFVARNIDHDKDLFQQTPQQVRQVTQAVKETSETKHTADIANSNQTEGNK